MMLFYKMTGKKFSLEIHQFDDDRFMGMIFIEGKKVKQTIEYRSAEHARIGLNSAVRKFNRDNPIYQVSLIEKSELDRRKSQRLNRQAPDNAPLAMTEDTVVGDTFRPLEKEKSTVYSEKIKALQAQLKENNTMSQSAPIKPSKHAPLSNISDDQTALTNKPKRQARKPFTPYGLNGYLVDKNGKVRLMLDRKATAKTITLEPEMFSMLADMVKATQSQQS
ncbi:hypothetical protein HPC38_02470 [Pasteurellaceae bacterium HPA106]|uniref:hypothetical protein n=1 Tax=Spirabiliibacterium pneumoniae TaxID=221400 RepID=UPI001AAD9BB9|nr:hypothetical protein [Spirabiliibacterium pneumoniae]MBE2895744.1 hypothetical protein [Spirabiliibacterium pneumoniae]